MKRLLVILIVILMIFTTTYAYNYKDLSYDHWAYQYIIDLSKKNVINGYTDGNFRPNGTITNAEFIKLVTVAALPEWIDIEDAESNLSHWAGKYIWIAERYGIIETGNVTSNNIDNPITRIEMVRIIAKADLIMNGNALSTNKKLTFKDVLTLNNDDLILLKHACSKELINGYTDNTFRPLNNMTRAEAATMIYRFKKMEVTL